MGGARIPTEDEWNELLNKTTVEWTMQNEVAGRKFTATNGNSIFLPAAGYRYDSEFDYAGENGLYWSSSLGVDDLYYPSPSCAYSFGFSSDYLRVNGNYRESGYSVRAVRASQN